MDGFNHAASVSDVRQVMAPQPVSVFGHYGTDWKTVLDEKQSSAHRFTSVKNFLHFAGHKPERHPWVQQSLVNAFDAATRSLFNERFVPPE